MTTGPALTTDPHYAARVRDNNIRLADTIRRRWPLPRREAESLAVVVRGVGARLSVFLKQINEYPVSLSHDGRFVVSFDIGVPLDDPGRRQTISLINEIVAHSGVWRPKGGDALVFETLAVFHLLSPAGKPTHGFLKTLKIHMPNSPVVQACLAAAERQEAQPYAKREAALKFLAEVVAGADGQSVRALKELADTPHGKARPLTAGEISLARTVFGSAIDYTKVLIVHHKHNPFQGGHTAVTPNGKIYLPKKIWTEDFSQGSWSDKALFIHEMVHVWQKQRGENVVWRRIFESQYSYTLVPGKRFEDYKLEQQGDIVRDYFYLLNRRWHVGQKMPDIKVYKELIPFAH